MPRPILPRTAALLEAKPCPLAKFDSLFATITQTRRVADGYFLHEHPDASLLLFIMNGVPYGVGRIAGEERAFLPIGEFFAAYRRCPESPLSFFSADKRLLLGLMVCFQQKPTRMPAERSSVDDVLQELEGRGGDAVLCLRAGEEWVLGLFARGRLVSNYFPPSAHALQMSALPAEQLQAYAATMSPLVEVYQEARIDPAPDVHLLTVSPGIPLTQLFLSPEPEMHEAEPTPVVESEPVTPGPAALDEMEPLTLESAHEWAAPAPAEPAPPAPPAEPARKGPVPEIYLFVGDRQIGTFSLASGEVTIGRTPGNTIVIDNPGVSRRHAVVRLEGERAVLEDLGSANGTFVNAQRVTRHELKDGDEIAVVKHRLLFRLPRTVEGGAKPEPGPEEQKTMHIDAAVAQAMAGGRQPARAEPAAPVLRPRLILPDLKKLQLEDREVTLGTGPDCNVALAGMFVARLHARIVPQKEGYKLIHVAGLAGTRVNGEKITEHQLKHGDEIEIGKQKILFRLER